MLTPSSCLEDNIDISHPYINIYKNVKKFLGHSWTCQPVQQT